MQKNVAYFLFTLLFVLGTLSFSHTAVAQEDEPRPTPNPSLRIVGGQNATPGEWPWQAFLFIDNLYQCGGSLIAPNWVLTAAHCVYDPSGTQLAGQVQITMGAHNISLGSEATRQVRTAAAIITHPNYNPTNFDNDVALLRVNTPFTLNSAVQTIDLAQSNAGDFAGATGWATGWGTTSEGGDTASILQEVALPVLSNSQCSSWINGVTANMVCAGFEAGGKDACQGDSGGPLAVQSGGNWTLIGITSWGDGCARPQSPGVWARVSRYTNWINGYLIDPTTFTESVFLPIVSNKSEAPPVVGSSFVNGDFEQGVTGWEQSSSNGYSLIVNVNDLPLAPHSGSWAAWLGGASNETSVIRQSVRIPNSNPHLVFWYAIGSDDDCGYDEFSLRINQSSVVDAFDLCSSNNTNGWARRVINMAAFAGQTVLVEFIVTTDESLNSNLLIDDVSLRTGAPDMPTAVSTPHALSIQTKSSVWE